MRLIALAPLLLLAACSDDDAVNQTNTLVEEEVEATLNTLEPGQDVTAIDAATDSDTGMVEADPAEDGDEE